MDCGKKFEWEEKVKPKITEERSKCGIVRWNDNEFGFDF